MSGAYLKRNRESLERLRELVSRLDDADMSRRLEDGWTVGDVRQHIAYWDQIALARWEAFDREGEFVSFTIEIADVINEASLPAWRALPGRAIRELVVQAAEAVDARTESLSPAALTYVEENERTFILERYSHREEHLEQIEQILGR